MIIQARRGKLEGFGGRVRVRALGLWLGFGLKLGLWKRRQKMMPLWSQGIKNLQAVGIIIESFYMHTLIMYHPFVTFILLSYISFLFLAPSFSSFFLSAKNLSSHSHSLLPEDTWGCSPSCCMHQSQNKNGPIKNKACLFSLHCEYTA